eukprot:950600-Amphidinium_carterae.1
MGRSQGQTAEGIVDAAEPITVFVGESRERKPCPLVGPSADLSLLSLLSAEHRSHSWRSSDAIAAIIAKLEVAIEVPKGERETTQIH